MDNLYLDNWIKEKIGADKNDLLSRSAITEYQNNALRNTILNAINNSSFYQNLYHDIDVDKEILSISDISKLPLIDEKTVLKHGTQMSCVPASQISRIVTLETSGSTGNPKRIFFTEEDQELMIDFVHHGMAPMVSKGDVFLILMPCERPGSVGDLVRIGLERRGIKTIPYGILPFDGSEDEKILNLIIDNNVKSMLSTASAAFRLAHLAEKNSKYDMHSILLSGEYVSEEIVQFVEKIWSCKVFEHYGMTESGLGGAVACCEHVGYHPREADLLYEIIDPNSGEVLPEGEIGELVFTTLTRKAMPFIRYKTGDYSRWIKEACPCGSILKRLSRVGSRKAVKGY